MTPFFQAGGALPNHLAYTPRHNLDNDAFNAALNGELLLAIAPRQVGKTSLLKRLRARLIEKGWRCVIVDLSALLGFSMVPWYSELGHKLAAELTPGTSPTLTNHLNMSAYLTGEAMQERYGLPLIAVFFDEVESVITVRDEQGQPFSDAFFMTIRDLYQKRDTLRGLLTISLAGAMGTAHLVKESRISPFNIGKPLSIDDFTRDETLAFTKHLHGLNVAVDEAVHETIYTWTNGHPYLTHRICAELEKMVCSGQLIAITAGDIEYVVKYTFLQPINPLLEDSNIRHVARMLKNLPESALPLWQRIRQGTATSRGSVDTETFAELYITGIIKNQDEHLVIRNRIYEEAFAVKNLPVNATPSPTHLTGTIFGRAMMKLDGKQYEQLLGALVDAFRDEESLRRMVRFGLNKNLAVIAGGKTLTDIVYNLIDWSQSLGKTEDLIIAARNANPDNPVLRVVAEQLHLAASGPSQGEVERMMLKSVKFNNPEQWRERMSKCELAVCRVEITDDNPVGTGFLVGKNLIMTNYHVVEDVIADPTLRDKVVLRFDYKYAADGVTLRDGITYGLVTDSDWLIASSPLNELDYALLCVNGTPGKDPIGGQNAAPSRGWLIPTTQTFEIGEPLLIIQHPKGAPLKITTGSVIKVTANQNRITYSANTLKGSSGSPCFNSDWDLVALHHFTNPIGNEGIIFSPILAILQQKNLLEIPS